MSYFANDKEDLVQCPYNRVHMVRIKRMPFHLMKCRKEHAGNEFVTCPFNARHEMPRPELRYHMATCVDRCTVEQDLVYLADREKGDEGTYFKGDTSVPTYFPEGQIFPPSENWDEETPSIVKIGVDPKHLDNPNKPVFKNVTGMTPAEKKAYKLKLQRRHARQQQGLPPEDSDEENSIFPPKPVPSQQLRKPHMVPQLLQQQQQNQMRPVNQPVVAKPSVFEYSLSKAGIGRGGGGLMPSKPVAQMNGFSNLVNIGQGRGAVRQGQAVPLKSSYAGLTNGYINSNNTNGYSSNNAGGGDAATAHGLSSGHGGMLGVGRGSVSGVTAGRGGLAGIAADYRAEPAGGGHGGLTAADDHTMLLQAMSRGRGGRAMFTPTVGNPPGFENAMTSAQHGTYGARADSLNDGFMKQPGAQQPAFIIPKVTNHIQSGTGSESSEGSVAGSSAEEDKAARLKEIKKLQKKLHGIEHLVKKQIEGAVLNEEELAKIGKKGELEDKIAALKL